MPDEFQYDVFLSHSSKDKKIIRPLAERLKKDGVKVWFDEWEIRPGDSIPAKIEEGLEHSRVLVLCMSANAFGSDWAQLESGTFRFRDPLNKERRFLPLRLDDAPIKGSLAQFLYINWQQADREQDYAKLLEACSDGILLGDIHSSPVASVVASSSTTLSFLRDRIEAEFERLDREAITPWAFLLTHGVSIQAPDGKKWRYSGVSFAGSVQEAFWNEFIEPFFRDIVWRSFDATAVFCRDRQMDLKSPLTEIALLLHQGLSRTLGRMAEIDRRLRGNGNPLSVLLRDTEDLRCELSPLIDNRLKAELGS